MHWRSCWWRNYLQSVSVHHPEDFFMFSFFSVRLQNLDEIQGLSQKGRRSVVLVLLHFWYNLAAFTVHSFTWCWWRCWWWWSRGKAWPSRQAWGWPTRTPWRCPPCPNTPAWTKTWWRSCGRTCCSRRDHGDSGGRPPPSPPAFLHATLHVCFAACCSTTTSTNRDASLSHTHGENQMCNIATGREDWLLLSRGSWIDKQAHVFVFCETTCGLNHTRGKLWRSALCLLNAVCKGGGAISHLRN